MKQHRVAVVRYEKPLDSVRNAVDLSWGLERLPAGARVFIKPNIVFWTKAVPFPKWGVITTSRVVEDMIVLLKERGIDDITVGEGMVTTNPKDRETPAHAYEALGYRKMKERYGIHYINIFDRPFQQVDLGDGIQVRFNTDVLESDFLVNLPVLKTHSQTVVSLGIKNLKGLIDIASRKKCHNTVPGKDLHVWVSRLADAMPPMITLIDGIFSNERGPGPDGKLRRTNLLVASSDTLSVDMVGARILGYRPERVPYIANAAKHHMRPMDFSDIMVAGERIEDVIQPHEHDFQYRETEAAVLPTPLVNQGIQGIFYHKYDLSMCTYCSVATGVMLAAIRLAWKGKPWNDVEVLTGKSMSPTPGKKKTILLGKCMVQAHKNHPDHDRMIPIRGCPPKPEDMLRALRKAGIEADPALFENVEALPGFYLGRYQNNPDYDEAFFQVQ